MIWIIREHGYGGSNLNVNLDFVDPAYASSAYANEIKNYIKSKEN